MGVINAVIKDANDDASTCDTFTPDRNHVDIITHRTTGLTLV